MSERPLLSIILVNWNVGELLAQCLLSLRLHCGDLDYEVIVIDNASSDGSINVIEKHFPWVHLVKNPLNEGFAKANNQGFALARGEYVFLLNPDTLITPGSVQQLLRVMRTQPDCGIVGPLVVNEHQQVVRACRRPFPSLTALVLHMFLFPQLWQRLKRRLGGGGSDVPPNYRQSGVAPCLQGSAMLIRRSALAQTGTFDERVPMYLDDSDLCTRMSQAGLLVLYCAEAKIIHRGAASVKRMANSRLSSLISTFAHDVYFLKNGGFWRVFIHHLFLGLSSLLFLAVDALLWLPLFFFRRKWLANYAAKHWHTLRYSLSLRLPRGGLPNHWPRRLALRDDWQKPVPATLWEG